MYAILDLRGGRVPPEVVVTGPERFEVDLVRFYVRGKEVIFRRQKAVRPTGGGDERHPPRAISQGPSGGRAQVEAAPRLGALAGPEGPRPLRPRRRFECRPGGR